MLAQTLKRDTVKMNRHLDALVHYHPCQYYMLARSSLETHSAVAFEKMLFAPLSRKHIQDMKTLIRTEQVVNILLIWQGSVKNSAVSVNTLISAVLLFDKLILRIRARGGNVYGL